MKAGDCGFAPLMIMSLPACCAQESSDSDKDMPDLVEVIMNPPRANFDPWWMVRFWKLFGGQTRLTIYVRIIVYIYIHHRIRALMVHMAQLQASIKSPHEHH